MQSMFHFIKKLCKYILYFLLVIVAYIIGSILISYTYMQSAVELWTEEGVSFIELSGGVLSYTQSNPESGSFSWDVLLIHWFAAWWKTWDYEGKYLSELGYRVTTLDLPPFWYSYSFQQDNYSREKQAEIIYQSIEKLGLQNIVLVAHSFGWKSAMELYFDHPKIFTKLILLDVALGFNWEISKPPMVEETSWDISFMSYDFFRNMLMRFVIVNTWIGTKALKSFLYYPEMLESKRLDTYKRPFKIQGKGDLVGEWAMTLSAPPSWKSLDPAKYSQVNIPVLIIWWKEDTVTPLIEWTTLANMIPTATLHILEEVNHIPHVEQPKKVQEIITKFLQNQ